MASIIEELRELEVKATPGEWSYYAGTVSAPKRKDFPNESPTFQAVSCVYQRDAALIATMRNALPSLLARLEALEAVAKIAEDAYGQFLTSADCRQYSGMAGVGNRMRDALDALKELP